MRIKEGNKEVKGGDIKVEISKEGVEEKIGTEVEVNNKVNIEVIIKDGKGGDVEVEIEQI